jgi:hypothetical protein
MGSVVLMIFDGAKLAKGKRMFSKISHAEMIPS